MDKRRQSSREQNTEPVRKPYLTGTITDENTLKSALGFFGIMLITTFVAFVVCATATFSSLVLRLLMNAAVILVLLMVYYNRGAAKGAEAVARGEILYQRREKGLETSEAERRICYHPGKGYIIGLIGTIPFLIAAIALAFSATVQMTTAGTLPSWMQAYVNRGDIGNALVNYTQPEGMTLTDMIRTVVRISILPYVNIVNYSNKNGMLLLERLSPLIVLIPAAAFGTGYLRGKKVRTQIHTMIKTNEQKRIRKEEKRKRRNARNSAPRTREPEQLN